MFLHPGVGIAHAGHPLALRVIAAPFGVLSAERGVEHFVPGVGVGEGLRTQREVELPTPAAAVVARHLQAVPAVLDPQVQIAHQHRVARTVVVEAVPHPHLPHFCRVGDDIGASD